MVAKRHIKGLGFCFFKKKKKTLHCWRIFFEPVANLVTCGFQGMKLKLMCAMHKEWEGITDYWGQNLSNVLQCKCHGTPHVAEALGEGDTAQRLTQELEASPQAWPFHPGLSPLHAGSLTQQWENPRPHAPPHKDWNIISKEVCVF